MSFSVLGAGDCHSAPNSVCARGNHHGAYGSNATGCIVWWGGRRGCGWQPVETGQGGAQNAAVCPCCVPCACPQLLFFPWHLGGLMNALSV